MQILDAKKDSDAKVSVERVDLTRSNMQTAKHMIVTWRVKGLKSDDPVVHFGAGELGLNRVTFLQAIVPGEHTSCVWGGEQKDVTVRLDGFPGTEFTLVCSVWGN